MSTKIHKKVKAQGSRYVGKASYEDTKDADTRDLKRIVKFKLNTDSKSSNIAINNMNINNAMLIVSDFERFESAFQRLSEKYNNDKLEYFNRLINEDIDIIYSELYNFDVVNEREQLYFESTVVSDIQCPKCGMFTIAQTEEHIRSLDEGSAVYNKCTSKGCHYKLLIS